MTYMFDTNETERRRNEWIQEVVGGVKSTSPLATICGFMCVYSLVATGISSLKL